MILPPPPRPATPRRLFDRLAAPLLVPPCLPRIVSPRLCLFPSSYRLLPAAAILPVLALTGAQSLRQRRRPAHAVVWLVIAQSLFRGRGIPTAWRHLHQSGDDPEPADSSFTQARQRLGARPMRLLFHRTCRPPAKAGLAGVFHGPWSAFKEIKGAMLGDKQPLLRSKEPTLVVQEVYGLLIGHYLVRQVLAQAAKAAKAEEVRLSLRRSLEVLQGRRKGEAGGRWLAGLCREVSRQDLRPKRRRRYPRVKKATRSRWPNKKPGAKPPPQPPKPFSKVTRILLSVGH